MPLGWTPAAPDLQDPEGRHEEGITGCGRKENYLRPPHLAASEFTHRAAQEQGGFTCKPNCEGEWRAYLDTPRTR